MKKLIICILALLMALSFVSCQNTNNSDKTHIESENSSDSAKDSTENRVHITEDMYVSWVNEIYLNNEDYLGATIRLEGMYTTFYSEAEDATYNLVYRIGPGCCGPDGDLCGFEFVYDGELPKENDWIEVEGILETYEVDGQEYLTLNASLVTIKSERGSEQVVQ